MKVGGKILLIHPPPKWPMLCRVGR